MNRRVIARDGLDNLRPTLCLPDKKHIAALKGVPEDKLDQMREIAIAWATDKAEPTEEYFLAYRENSSGFRILHRHNGTIEEESFTAI